MIMINGNIYCDMKKRIKKMIGSILENERISKYNEREIAIVLNKLTKFEDNDILYVDFDSTEVIYDRTPEHLMYIIYEDYCYEEDITPVVYNCWLEKMSETKNVPIKETTINAISKYIINKENK